MEKELVIFAAAEKAVASSEAISAKWVGKVVPALEWISIHFVELEVAAACAKAAKIGPAWSRKFWAVEKALHEAFAASAWEKAA